MKQSAQFAVIGVALAILTGCGGRVEAEAPPKVSPECLAYYGEPKHPFTPTEFPVEVVIDTQINNDKIGLILDAIDLWNNQVNSEVLYATITSDLYAMHGDCNFTTVTTKTQLPDIHAGLTTFGPCSTSHIDILTGPALTAQQTLNIVAHELGHVLGVPHDDDDPFSVMYPKLQTFNVQISQRSTCFVKIARNAAEAE